MTTSRCRYFVLSIVLFCLFTATAKANSGPSYSFDSAILFNDPGSYVLGIRFTVNTDVSVTALGYFDASAYSGQYTGLLISHDVGVYDENGVLLSSTTIEAGSSNALVGFFRYREIVPFTLDAGHSYTMAGVTLANMDPYAYGVEGQTIGGFAVNPALSIAHFASYNSPGSVLQYPVLPYEQTLYAGPNILVQAVPEPSSFILVIVGALGLAVLSVWRERNRTGPSRE